MMSAIFRPTEYALGHVFGCLSDLSHKNLRSTAAPGLFVRLIGSISIASHFRLVMSTDFRTYFGKRFPQKVDLQEGESEAYAGGRSKSLCQKGCGGRLRGGGCGQAMVSVGRRGVGGIEEGCQLREDEKLPCGMVEQILLKAGICIGRENFTWFATGVWVQWQITFSP
jgi:hypothetical protein